ncbi:MAG: hypothetical protein LJE65_05115 [Desulfobacteraceae bacterium]|nr:hypothetical protein [Desulfobacteraceae bacterium]
MIQRIFVFLLIPALLGCATMGGIRRMQQFNRVQKQYQSYMLRSDLEAASGMLAPDGPESNRLDREEMKLIQVTRYDVKETVVSEDKSTVYQLVEIHYYRNDRPVEKIVQDRQEWGFDEETGQWLLKSGFPPLL